MTFLRIPGILRSINFFGRKIVKIIKIQSLVLCLLFSAQAFSWGRTGHRVVGQVAEKHLSKSAAQAVKNILGGESLARVSTWPDKIKSDPQTWGHTFSWHYTDWPDGDAHYNEEHNNGTIVKAIKDNLQVLKNLKASKADKRVALSFVVHLVGDLHMPLHVGNGKDRGGNDCKVLFHKTETNLHRLWDENLIDFELLSFTEMANIVTAANKRPLSEIQSGKIVDWARESKEIRVSGLYPEENSLTKDVTSDRPSYCDRGADLSSDKLPKLSYEYSYKWVPVVERRLLEAGVRLAWLLNNHL